MVDVNTSIGEIVGGPQNLWIPANQMYAGSIASPAAAGNFNLGTTLAVTTWDFDDTTEEEIAFTFVLPNRWNLGTWGWDVYWTANSATTDSAYWGLRGMAISGTEVIDTTNGPESQSAPHAHSGTANTLNVSSFAGFPIQTKPGTYDPQPGDLCFLKIRRSAANGGDTLVGDARLLGVRFTFTSDAPNDT